MRNNSKWLHICLPPSTSSRKVFRPGMAMETGSGLPPQDHRLVYRDWGSSSATHWPEEWSMSLYHSTILQHNSCPCPQVLATFRQPCQRVELWSLTSPTGQRWRDTKYTLFLILANNREGQLLFVVP